MIARFFKEIGRVDELGSGVRNTYKYCGLYSPGATPEFIEGDVFKAIVPIKFFQTSVRGTVKSTRQVTVEVSGEATREISGEVQKVVGAIEGEMKRVEIQKNLGLKHDDYFRLNYIDPALKTGLIEMK